MILMFFLVSRSLQWLFLSASFHSQCPRGSLAKGKRCGRAEEVMQELAPENYVKEPNMTLYQLIYFFFLILRFIMLLIFWVFFCVSIVIVAFFLSASFHSGCRHGSLAKGKRHGSTEQVIQELAIEN